jgi:hypothetical protein
MNRSEWLISALITAAGGVAPPPACVRRGAPLTASKAILVDRQGDTVSCHARGVGNRVSCVDPAR